MRVKTKKERELTLRDRLSRLSYADATKYLGEDGGRLIQLGGKAFIDIDGQVEWRGDRFRLQLPEARVEIRLADDARRRLLAFCSACEGPCEHLGAAFSLILEEKTPLGLAVVPPEKTPIESLSPEELLETAIAERAERARTEKMTLRSVDPETPWTDYTVLNKTSGRTYRVSLRGLERGDSYCSCPDFRKNTLGTCKHLLLATERVRKRFPRAELDVPFRPSKITVHLQYGAEVELRVLLPTIRSPEIKKIVAPLRGKAINKVPDLVRRIRRLEAAGRDVLVYPDAEEYIDQAMFRERMADFVETIRRDPEHHPLRKTLLDVELLPYQLDGIAFAVGAGRAILADDMGLGKTIQGVGVAELLAREVGISKVLVVCPASVKGQWKAEIERFCSRTAHLVAGSAASRAEQYRSEDTFYTVCNYEQVLRDILAVEQVPWDLIILDEAQRIKNWEAKTSQVIKGLRSRFALALTGTPLENRLDDLFSVVEFVNERQLGPAFQFYNTHRVVAETGKVLGYKNLGELREKLGPVMLRRTRASVMKQLPPRTTEIVRVQPTAEQLELHRGWMLVVHTIIEKKYISEMDLIRLQKALLMCRRVANSTFLIDREGPGYSTKLEKLEELLESLASENDRKIVLFSEWTTMLDLIEPLLEKNGMGYVRLDGSVPQKNRPGLVRQFREDPNCRVFVTTNAGSTGLNLQAANTVVNVDLPWNPAILEQRIGRAHRMGQKRPVQVYLMVTNDTIEENILGTLSAKHELATASLDLESNVEEVHLESGVEELKRRLEVLIGAKPEAPRDESERRFRETEAERLARRERVSSAGGKLLSSAFEFLRSMLPEPATPDEDDGVTKYLHDCFEDCVTKDDSGKPTLTLTLPDDAALQNMTKALAALVAYGNGGSSQN